MQESKRQRLEKLRVQLESERSSFMTHWRELGDYILPRRPRFTLKDVNKGEKKNQKIVDSTATFAARTARSGMMSGITSPARRWFRLATHDKSIIEDADVKAWLHTVTEAMNTVFTRSNLYNSLPIVYGDLVVFGTAAMMVMEDYDKVIHTQHFPIGSYFCSANNRGNIDTFGRTFQMTVRQIVKQFGTPEGANQGELDMSNISDTVQRLWKEGRTEDWIEVAHIIMPNDEYNPEKPESKFKKYVSVYYELSCSSGSGKYAHVGQNEEDRFLRVAGYDRFTVLVPRWEVNSEDSYATDCPGMQALGDIKQLQLGERRAMQAIEKMVNPPLVGPGHLRNSAVSMRAGDITYLDVRDAANGLRPIHDVRPQIQDLEVKQQSARDRIRHAMFENLFLALTMSDRREITAREVEERHEEKMWALGPVLERLNQDLLDPLIDLTFEYMNRQGLIPEPPEVLQGMDLKIEYVSVMAEAQKLINLKSVERFTQHAANLAAINPAALDKLDIDQMMDVYGELTGIPPGLVKPDDQVAAEREERAKAQAQQQRMNSLQQGAATMKDAAQAAATAPEGALEAALGGGQG